MTWSGVSTQTLTTSYVASDAQAIDFGKRITVYPSYTRGAAAGANTLQYQILLNPYDATTDSANAYWFVYGIYTNSSGTWTIQPASYTTSTGTAQVQENTTPLVLEQIDAAQIKIQVKETQSVAAAGTVRVLIEVNDPVNSH
jgi:hypothetical protein